MESTGRLSRTQPVGSTTSRAAESTSFCLPAFYSSSQPPLPSILQAVSHGGKAMGTPVLELRALHSRFSCLFAFPRVILKQMLLWCESRPAPSTLPFGGREQVALSVHLGVLLAPSHGQTNVLGLAGLAGRRSVAMQLLCCTLRRRTLVFFILCAVGPVLFSQAKRF